MKNVILAAIAVAGMIAAVACAKGPEAQATKSSESATRSSESAPKSSASSDQKPAPDAFSQLTRALGASTPPATEGPSRASATETRDLCALVSAKEVTEITGVPIERVEKKPNGCEWYANAAVRQQNGADTARSTFEKMSKQEPASYEEDVCANGDPGKQVCLSGLAVKSLIRY